MKQYLKFNQETGDPMGLGPNKEGTCIEIEGTTATAIKDGFKQMNQFNEIKASYVEIQLGQMSLDDLVDFAREHLFQDIEKMTEAELQEDMENSQDENLYDELVENSLIDDEVEKEQHFSEILHDREVPDVY